MDQLKNFIREVYMRKEHLLYSLTWKKAFETTWYYWSMRDRHEFR